jgi:ribose transport system ATP-binding protein
MTSTEMLGPPQRPGSAAALEVVSVTKAYGPNVVLRDVSLAVAEGEVVAVIGENGAGKSTLAKMIAGVIRPDRGEIRVGGKPVALHSPRDALQVGIGFIPQELAYFPNLTVAENILCGSWPTRHGLVSARALERRAADAAAQFGVDLDIQARMSDLTVGERQLVEIVKALSREATMLILDEPTAALTQSESTNLFRVLGDLARQRYGIVYISHRMDEVFRFSDRVDVLRNGDLVASEATATATPADLIEQMLGQAAGEVGAGKSAARSDRPPVIALHGLSLAGEPGLNDVSFSVEAGEVVVLFGLRGSGADLVAEGLAGLQRGIAGEVEFGGRPAQLPGSPRAARRAGVGYVPAERKRDGLVLTMSVQENLGLLIMKALSRFGVMRTRAEQRAALKWTGAFNVRATSLRQRTGELSGGNQQKVMVASRMATAPRLFVLQEPTRGVDIGARVELHRFMRETAAEGVGMLVVSTDVEEAVLLADRLLVLRNGTVIAELTGATKTQGRALSLAAGEAA